MFSLQSHEEEVASRDLGSARAQVGLRVFAARSPISDLDTPLCQQHLVAALNGFSFFFFFFFGWTFCTVQHSSVL